MSAATDRIIADIKRRLRNCPIISGAGISVSALPAQLGPDEPYYDGFRDFIWWVNHGDYVR